MATSSDTWMKEYTEASKLVDDISTMIADRGSLPQSGPEIMRHTSAIRRKITILGTRLDSLATLLSRIPPNTDKELHKRQDMLSNLKSKAKQMATSFNMSNFANREDLLGQGKKAADDMSRVAGLDNQGIVGLQRQVMKEQDEGLERLEETVLSTKHIALAVNEELTLHTRLIVSASAPKRCYKLPSSACAKEACNSQQAHQRRLLMHVPAAICGRHSGSRRYSFGF